MQDPKIYNWRDTYLLVSNNPSVVNNEDNALASSLLISIKKIVIVKADVYMATRVGTGKILRYLLESSNVEQSQVPIDILTYAAQWIRIDAVRYLLTREGMDRYATIHQGSKYPRASAIGAACTACDDGNETRLELVQLLIDSGLIAMNDDVSTSIRHGDDDELVRLLISQPSINLTRKMEDPMYLASSYGRRKIASLLLSDCRIVPTMDCLMIACNKRYAEVARLLLEDGRIVPTEECLEEVLDKKRSFGGREIRAGVMDLLLRDQRIDLTCRYAALQRWKEIDIVQMSTYWHSTMSIGLNMKMRIDIDRELMREVLQDNVSAVDIMLERGLDSNCLGVLLLLAVIEDCYKVVRLLLSYSRYPEWRMKEALDLARLRSHSRMITLLVRHV
jgi:hypothetical protein